MSISIIYNPVSPKKYTILNFVRSSEGIQYIIITILQTTCTIGTPVGIIIYTQAKVKELKRKSLNNHKINANYGISPV